MSWEHQLAVNLSRIIILIILILLLLQVSQGIVYNRMGGEEGFKSWKQMLCVAILHLGRGNPVLTLIFGSDITW